MELREREYDIKIEAKPKNKRISVSDAKNILDILKKKAVGFAANLRSEYRIRPEDDFGVYTGLNFDYGAEKWNVYGGYNFAKNTYLTEHDSDITYFKTEN